MYSTSSIDYKISHGRVITRRKKQQKSLLAPEKARKQKVILENV
jgi:hypothetical protein